jgi:hypothetical protein
VKVIDDEVMCCTDCLMIVANDDASGLDYYLESEAATKREAHIRECIDALCKSVEGGYLACGDGEDDEEFSWHGCDVCGSGLGGTRHQLVLLGEGEDEEDEDDGDGDQRVRCSQCEALMINGILCHETGCPNSHLTWNGQEWVNRNEQEDDD